MTSPKARLLANKPLAKALEEVVDDPRFQEAADIALLEVVNGLPDSVNAAEAIAYYNRVVGARDYLKKLLTLADKAKPLPPAPSPDNLNHKV